MKFNLYTIYDIVAKKGGKIYLAVNDEVAKRQFNETLEAWKKQGLTILREDLTVLNIGIYNTNIIENKDINNKTESYEDAIICERVYDIYNIPNGYKPKAWELEEEEANYYKQTIKELKKQKKEDKQCQEM